MKKILLIGAFLLFLFWNKNSYVDLEDYQSKEIEVEIKGEVLHPGVYQLPYNAKTKQLVEKAQPLEHADTSTLNLSKQLRHEDVIVIPAKSERQKISINAGSIEELASLPGIGPATAQKIVDYRNEHGAFQNVEDIMQVKGIKEKLFLKIKDYICL
ncbi:MULTISPECIES: ComEA family DNA-binding protein [unclassified Breznakia]|uniref:ComEA family DNA-binding protein n=1 Tax=unclassified Breznakia TaxID=2623764 RepID=UPI002473DE7B|nr:MULTISPECIES: ComEA family DNA-binding protein [unclassified Breznakia]MDH6366777.1 competence protein ComEA [Breznakia sp. PH1-1]MDH6403836.1 competence protein ComEA [Breznakia sp. PF1-11]MDH6411545.1 competence protein ComEA [Breznakia sp. PFB1-11]MDH6413909.1 competence protein ComEA [Breznakia sp. PFB1-14]MDH6416338.1 competence protein ComEA [Breznakia sp. PFB1-4]